MSRKIIIAAITRNLAIGIKGDMPYHISADLRRFKSLTMGYPIIMGRRTFESFPTGALPGRRNIVISRNPEAVFKDAEKVSSLEDALRLTADAEKVFIIGGGQIYSQAMNLADELDLTEIDAVTENADTFFPEITHDWVITSQTDEMTDPRSGAKFRFTCRKRK